MTPINVYIASKLRYAQRFREMRDSWKKDKIFLHARWFDHEQHEDSATDDDFRIFWRVDEHDVKSSNAIIVYGERNDELRGALVEAGMAMGAGILTIVVGDAPAFGTWCHHPMVVRASTLEHAKQMLLRLFGGK